MNLYSSLVLYLIFFVVFYIAGKVINLNHLNQKWVQYGYNTLKYIFYLYTIFITVKFTLFVVKNLQ